MINNWLEEVEELDKVKLVKEERLHENEYFFIIYNKVSCDCKVYIKDEQGTEVNIYFSNYLLTVNKSGVRYLNNNNGLVDSIKNVYKIHQGE